MASLINVPRNAEGQPVFEVEVDGGVSWEKRQVTVTDPDADINVLMQRIAARETNVTAMLGPGEAVIEIEGRAVATHRFGGRRQRKPKVLFTGLVYCDGSPATLKGETLKGVPVDVEPPAPFPRLAT